jgi:myosin-crossreactive antigen
VKDTFSKLNIPNSFKCKLAGKTGRRLAKKGSLKDLLSRSSTKDSTSSSRTEEEDLKELDVDEVKKD